MSHIIAIIAALALPTAEVEVGVHNRQTKFGEIEHDAAVGSVEGEIGMYGLSFDWEWIFDGHGGRELTLGPGYFHTFEGDLKAGFKYLFERHPERIEEPTQFAVPSVECDCLLHPTLEWWLDTDRNRWSSYWSADIGHSFDAPFGTRLDLSAGAGLSDMARLCFKDMHARAALDIPVCRHLSVVPYIGLVHRFNHHDAGCDCILCTGAALAMNY